MERCYRPQGKSRICEGTRSLPIDSDGAQDSTATYSLVHSERPGAPKFKDLRCPRHRQCVIGVIARHRDRTYGCGVERL